LICAACSGPVEQARCPVCRAARAEVHHPHPFAGVPPAALVAIVALIALVLLLLSSR
jgi:hypothetical protein